MGRHIATCNHEAKEGGIAFSINGHTRMGLPCLNYKTYCAKCTLELLIEPDSDLVQFSDILKDTEMGKLRDMVQDALRE